MTQKIELIIIDAQGDRAFCSGGDISDLYEEGSKGNFAYGKKFWDDEYRLNSLIAKYPKPYIAFMQGFTMGGGVGISCHGSHRIVCETSKIAMPECSIGLIPDVGGSLLLSKAPNNLGYFLGLTGTQMNAADAVYAGFADIYIPKEEWTNLIDDLEKTGDITILQKHSRKLSKSQLYENRKFLRVAFQSKNLSKIALFLSQSKNQLAHLALEKITKNCPIAMTYTIEMLSRLTPESRIEDALDLEYNSHLVLRNTEASKRVSEQL